MSANRRAEVAVDLMLGATALLVVSSVVGFFVSIYG